MSSTLIDVFSPTPRVGTSGGAQHTPGGTRVPEGPPPPTPPRAQGYDASVSVPSSPIGPPPAPPPHLSPSGTPAFGSKGSEEPSRLVHSLPMLEVAENKHEASVVAAGDWLARIAPIMRSLSPSAPSWWNQVIALLPSTITNACMRIPFKSSALRMKL